MRIISKFKDYYDIVAGQGVDLTKVFTRTTTQYKGNFPLPGWDDEKTGWRLENRSPYPRINRGVYRNNRSEAYTIGYIYVLFAGKLYGGLALKSGEFGSIGEMSYYWDAASWKAKAEEINYNGDSRAYYSKDKSTEMDEMLRLLAVKGDEVLSDWAVSHKVSVAVTCEFFHTREQGRWFVVDANLKDLNFQKVLDPFTAYQELEMWVGGVIGQNPQPAEVSDAVKIQQHGFDKWSFRKHKLDNK